MDQEDKLPITISSQGESQIFSGSFEMMEFWNLCYRFRDHSRYQFSTLLGQANSGHIYDTP